MASARLLSLAAITVVPSACSPRGDAASNIDRAAIASAINVVEAGDMAVYSTRYAYTFTDPASGGPDIEIGNWVIVCKRHADGSTKIFRAVISDLPGER
ncbi:MAG: hypothetical protein WA918_08150 [Erythrobacter sp.]